MLFAGIDIGSTITKVVIRDERSIIQSTIRPTGAEHRRLAHEVMRDTLEKAGLDFEQIDFIVATGYGRINVPFADAQVSEITCHMRGVSWLFPNVRTVIDIGGQDSKGIKVVDGKVRNFIMNDKCAAGTGRFLEIIADTLGLKLEEIGDISLRSREGAGISKTGDIYAEQEVLLRLAESASVPEILAGIHKAVADRSFAMVSKNRIERNVIVTGGGAKNAGLRKGWKSASAFQPCLRVLITEPGASILPRNGHEILEGDGTEEKGKNNEATTFST